jgi:PAS domain S-box-containing protein
MRLAPRPTRRTRERYAAAAWAGPACVTIAVCAALFILSVRGDQEDTTVRVLAVTGACVGTALSYLTWYIATRLQRTNRIATDSVRRLESAAATGHELVWEIDPNGDVTYMSDVARAMFGVEPDVMLGRSVFDLLSADRQNRARSLLEQSVRGRRGWTALTFEAPDGSGGVRWVETSGVAHLDDRGAVRGFTATTRVLDPDAVQRLTLQDARRRIESVLAGRQLSTVFQPIVQVATGDVVGYEALSRFDTEPAQTPDRWFADAERVGLVIEFDLLALRSAFAAAEQLPEGAYVSVNVTPTTLQSRRLVDAIEAAPLPGDRIVVEITEHVSVEDYQILREPLSKLRELGVRLAVDDAGAGYASFRHILLLRPEFIKLDREINSGIHTDAARRALAAAVAIFALDVGATVIAEGVETGEEASMIATLGIDAIQGYLFGRPTADLEDLRRSRRADVARYRDSAIDPYSPAGSNESRAREAATRRASARHHRGT